MSADDAKQLSHALLSLVDTLAEGDNQLDRESLKAELKSLEVDPVRLHRRLRASLTEIVRREERAGRAVPLQIRQALDESLGVIDGHSSAKSVLSWAQEWLNLFSIESRPLWGSGPQMAYRKRGELVEKDFQGLIQIEQELKSKAQAAGVTPPVDLVSPLSRAVLDRFGLDCGRRLTEVAVALGVEVVYREAESYDGALLCMPEISQAAIILNSKVREESRKRFTLAHELGHYLLPGQAARVTPCPPRKIESWDETLYRGEQEANRFAAEILMPREWLEPFLSGVPSIDSIRLIARTCGTSLTASAVRLISLTNFPVALVWSEDKRVKWHRSSSSFVRWIRKGHLRQESAAWQFFQTGSLPNDPVAVPARAWLFEKGLRRDLSLIEHSIALPNYAAVLTLLILQGNS